MVRAMKFPSFRGKTILSIRWFNLSKQPLAVSQKMVACLHDAATNQSSPRRKKFFFFSRTIESVVLCVAPRHECVVNHNTNKCKVLKCILQALTL